MIPWMLYAALVGTLIAAGAFAVERLVASQGNPRRFVWLAALGLAVVIPVAGGLRGTPAPSVADEAENGPRHAAGESTLWMGISSVPLPAVPPISARTAALAWAIGSAAALATLCSVLLVVACARRRWPRSRVDGTDVHLSRRFGPALVGIARPAIVVPRWVVGLARAEQAAIVRHELEHARARDHLALLCGGLIVAAFPWNPAIWFMCRRLRAAVELDCDRRVIAGGIDAADYGAVLLQAGSRSQTRWGFAPAMGQPRSLLERRLKTMSEKTTRLNPLHGLLLACAAAVALAVACDTRSPTQLNEAIDEVVTENRDQEQTPSATADGQPMPLVVVDGKRVSPEDMAPGDDGDVWPYLAALDIARLEIIKGPAAKEIYGEEAAGGVIQIFTTDGEASAGEQAGDDSSFGFEFSLPKPTSEWSEWNADIRRGLGGPTRGSEWSEWNPDINFSVGMPAPGPEGLTNIVRAMTSGVAGAEITLEGDGSLRGWFQVSPATPYGVVHELVETIGAAGRAPS